jgi:hypothetical protein
MPVVLVVHLMVLVRPVVQEAVQQVRVAVAVLVIQAQPTRGAVVVEAEVQPLLIAPVELVVLELLFLNLTHKHGN